MFDTTLQVFDTTLQVFDTTLQVFDTTLQVFDTTKERMATSPITWFTDSAMGDRALEAESPAFVDFKAAVGLPLNERRVGLCRPAWRALDPTLLPNHRMVGFARESIERLAHCIARERDRRRILTPTYAAPDAVTLLPSEAPAEPEPATVVDVPRKDEFEEFPASPARFVLEAPPTKTKKQPSATAAAAAAQDAIDDARTKARTEMAVWPTPKRPPLSSSSGDRLVDVMDRSPARSSALTSMQMGLPSVAEPERAAPNFWLRSSLFGITTRKKKGDRRRFQMVTKVLTTPSMTGSVEYHGNPLDQADLDLMLQVVHMATTHGAVGEPVRFTDRSLLKALGKTYGTSQVKWLDDAAQRLLLGVLTVRTAKNEFVSFHLLETFGRSAADRVFVINQAALSFFMGTGWTALQWQARLSLRGQLTRWLHGYLTSQPTTANGVSLSLLKEMSGTAATQPMRNFKSELKKSLAQIPLLGQPGADLHLGLQSAAIVDGKRGPKLVWMCDQNRQESLRVLRDEENLRALRAPYQEED